MMAGAGGGDNGQVISPSPFTFVNRIPGQFESVQSLLESNHYEQISQSGVALFQIKSKFDVPVSEDVKSKQTVHQIKVVGKAKKYHFDQQVWYNNIHYGLWRAKVHQ